MENLNEFLLKQSKNLYEYVVNIRRKIHSHPELGMQEFKTSQLICEELDKMGIPYKKGIAKTGVVGLIEGREKGKVIGFRADMDALPLQEKNNVPYASKIDGVMHACGHDGHVAMLLGAAKVLKDLKDHLKGSVKLIFQPAEEGPGGAKPMIEEGVLENPKVDAMVGFHLSSGDKTGVIGFKKGPIHAAYCEFRILIKGKGGHAAYPHLSTDAIVMAAQSIMGFQTVISRRKNPTQPAVLTVGTIKGGYRHNIIADEVEMTGTYRFLDEKIGRNLRIWTEEVLKGVTEPLGGKYEIEYFDGYPPTVNDENLHDLIKKWLLDLLGEEHIEDMKEASMGAEDFSYFSQKVPSLFMKLGAGGENKEFSNPHHHPQFDFDEKALPYGVACFSKIAMEFLS